MSNTEMPDVFAPLYGRAQATLVELENLLQAEKRVPVARRNAAIFEAAVLLAELWSIVGDTVGRLSAIQRILTPQPRENGRHEATDTSHE